MNIVFMGTPDFAVPCLQKLIDLNHNITGVFTQPDKPKGRHAVLTAPPVKELALKYGIPVYQPVKMRDGEAFNYVKIANPDLIVVTAFGKILPEDILNYPKFGCINIHASLLPSLRGAAPIQWSILNGFSKTGVTSMQMDAGLDTGDMILKAEIEIGNDENAESLHDRLSVLGAETLEKTLALLESDKLVTEKQDDSKFTYAPILSKELSPIKWDDTAQKIHNQVRGLYGWPCACCELFGKTVKIHKTKLTDIVGEFPGQVIKNDNELLICCGDLKCISVLSIQPESKKRMDIQDYLRGLK